MSLESALRELGKEIQKDERFAALQAAAKANDGDEKLQQQMQELQLISLKYQQEAEKANDADKDRIESLQADYQKLYGEIMESENMQKYSAAASAMEEMAQYISGMMGLFLTVRTRRPVSCPSSRRVAAPTIAAPAAAATKV